MKIDIGNGNGKSNLKVRAGAREKQIFEQEVRRSRVIGMHTKGLTQMEIGQRLGVNHSTISDDIRYIKELAKWSVVEVADNLSFEYVKNLAAMNEIERSLWEISDFQIDPNNMDTNYIMTVNMSNKNRIAALTLLLEVNKHRNEVVTGGTRSTHDHVGMTVMSHGHEMKQAMMTRDERIAQEREILRQELTE
jgi:DNA-binding transcriptional regulator LsrR (DeoR family)